MDHAIGIQAARPLLPPRSVSAPAVVLFVHGSAEMYGSDKVLLNLVTEFAAQGEFHPVVVLHEQGPLAQVLQDAGIEVHVATVIKIHRAMFTPVAPLLLLQLARRALREIDRIVARRPVALVHSNTLAVLGGACWARCRGVHHLWHVHEIILKPAFVGRALAWLASRFSGCVVNNSSLTQDWLLRQAPALAGRSRVIFNGLGAAPPLDAAAALAFRLRVGARPGDTVVTVAGRLNHWKGQNLLIEAFGVLRRQCRLARLRLAIVGDVFAGQDDIRTALIAQAAQEGVGDVVHFVSFVSDIYAVWRGSDIAVVPSLEPEPFGMVAIEAMACALPVVAAAHGGLLDIVQPGVTGLLFEPRNAPALADALAVLADNPDLRRRLGTAGAARQVREFSLASQVAQTAAAYRQLIAT